MTRRALIGALALLWPWWTWRQDPKPATTDSPPWRRDGSVVVGITEMDFSGGTLIDDVEVNGDVLFEFPAGRPRAAWVPRLALADVAKQLREVFGATTWGVRRLGGRVVVLPPPPPEKLDRLFRMMPEQRVARLKAIEARPTWELGQVIQDTEIDLARWRTELRLRHRTPKERLDLAETILESMEARLRIWIDRHVERL